MIVSSVTYGTAGGGGRGYPPEIYMPEPRRLVNQAAGGQSPAILMEQNRRNRQCSKYQPYQAVDRHKGQIDL